ncbi:hypothetical protein J6590_037335 [Homalodisca vitripennis]|nr:hypothetical protein J6590_037335 [Homalodisca vitripennis]
MMSPIQLVDECHKREVSQSAGRLAGDRWSRRWRLLEPLMAAGGNKSTLSVATLRIHISQQRTKRALCSYAPGESRDLPKMKGKRAVAAGSVVPEVSRSRAAASCVVGLCGHVATQLTWVGTIRGK